MLIRIDTLAQLEADDDLGLDLSDAAFDRAFAERIVGKSDAALLAEAGKIKGRLEAEKETRAARARLASEQRQAEREARQTAEALTRLETLTEAWQAYTPAPGIRVLAARPLAPQLKQYTTTMLPAIEVTVVNESTQPQTSAEFVGAWIPPAAPDAAPDSAASTPGFQHAVAFSLNLKPALAPGEQRTLRTTVSNIPSLVDGPAQDPAGVLALVGQPPRPALRGLGQARTEPAPRAPEVRRELETLIAKYPGPEADAASTALDDHDRAARDAVEQAAAAARPAELEALEAEIQQAVAALDLRGQVTPTNATYIARDFNVRSLTFDLTNGTPAPLAGFAFRVVLTNPNDPAFRREDELQITLAQPIAPQATAPVSVDFRQKASSSLATVPNKPNYPATITVLSLVDEASQPVADTPPNPWAVARLETLQSER